jgi:hypothetical protein
MSKMDPTDNPFLTGLDGALMGIETGGREGGSTTGTMAGGRATEGCSTGTTTISGGCAGLSVTGVTKGTMTSIGTSNAGSWTLKGGKT